VTAFADSSAIVKLYVDEADYRIVRDLSFLVISAIARVEVPAAFWRKQRTRQMSASDAALLTTAFEFDYYGNSSAEPRFAAIAVTDDVIDLAAHSAARHGLRAYDAVQLASAVLAREASHEITRFVAFDTDLREAAAAEAFTLVP
jgi:uncharacterized protein